MLPAKTDTQTNIPARISFLMLETPNIGFGSAVVVNALREHRKEAGIRERGFRRGWLGTVLS